VSEQDPVVPTGGVPPGREGPTDLVLVAGMAWIALAVIGVVPSAILVASGGATASVGMMVTIALVVLPFVNVFQLWHSPTALNAVRTASYSFALAAIAIAAWIAGKEFEPLVAVVGAGLALPGVLSLLAAWQIHEREPVRAAPAAGSADRFALSTSVVVVLVVVALVAAYLLLTPTFGESFAP
jgi:hypothetical protein